MRNRFPVTLWLTLVALVAALALPARANTWPLPPPGSRLVGQNQFHVVQDDGGSLEAIAKKYNVGFLALLQANPGVDPYVPRAGSVLTIPPADAAARCAARRAGDKPRRTAPLLLPAGQK
ncbi:LysM domain/ErfK/YbiS/YcfS/YnhG family protein [Klebsiella pneumoniae]|nr:LysM domain/ErfK/YbiS/YcfS/YnhG family protein [Klebsiella pneumoniae]